jgi:2-polyprenyl-3-methyl-5-hydroxy-6-metoxy-1,4-benzoquinol methylase
MTHAVDDPYLLRRLEEANSYFSSSFSNRYMNFRRRSDIEEAVKKEVARLRPRGDAAQVLDLGCGDGSLIYLLKSRLDADFLLDCTGLDLNVLDIQFALRRQEFYGHERCCFLAGDIRSAVLPESSFDVVIASEVIEHLAHPEILARKISTLLRPGGLGLITTPRQGGGVLTQATHFLKKVFRGKEPPREEEDAQLLRSKERALSRFSSDGGQTGAGLDHVSVKSAREWKKLFDSCGLKTVRTKGTSGFFFGGPVLDRHPALFGFVVLLDTLTRRWPGSDLWSETLFFEIRKP